MSSVGSRIRLAILLLFAFWRDQKKLIVISFLLGIFSYLFLTKFSPLIFENRNENIGLVGKYTLSNLPLEVQSLISQGLTCISSDGSAVPCLASSWEVSDDGKEYIFNLRHDIFWQDGKRVVASDINYNFSDVAIEILAPDKIKFILKLPFAPFPVIVSRPIFKKSLLGTGSYRVLGVSKNGEIVEKLQLSNNRSFRFYPSESAVRTAFKLGEINKIENLADVGELQGWKNIQISPVVKYNRFVGIFFDTQNQKFSDKSVRQALAYAIKDRWEPRALNPINPGSWAYNPQVKTYEYDSEKAAKMLEKVNAEGGSAKPEEITISTIPSLISVAEAIKADWEVLGIKVHLKIIQSLDEGFEVLLASEEIYSDPDQYSLWHSTQTTNITHLRSPKIDKLLEDGRKTLDVEKRKSLYFEFQKAIVEEAPVIFLFHPTLYTVSRK